jgi:hypothetical protein
MGDGGHTVAPFAKRHCLCAEAPASVPSPFCQIGKSALVEWLGLRVAALGVIKHGVDVEGLRNVGVIGPSAFSRMARVHFLSGADAAGRFRGWSTLSIRSRTRPGYQ